MKFGHHLFWQVGPIMWEMTIDYFIFDVKICRDLVVAIVVLGRQAEYVSSFALTTSIFIMGSVHLLANFCDFCSGYFLVTKAKVSQKWGSQQFPAVVIGKRNLQRNLLPLMQKWLLMLPLATVMPLRAPILSGSQLLTLWSSIYMLAHLVFNMFLQISAEKWGALWWLQNGERFDGFKMGSTIPFVYLHCL